MSWKRLFSRALAANPARQHFAAHSHHLWPDASRDGQLRAWDDAARLADHKWDVLMGEVWPEAQNHVARELGLPNPASVAFATNVHDFLIRIVSALPTRPVRILASDGEFHSFRRQAARWLEDGTITLETVATGPGFDQRFTAAARAGGHDLIWISHVMFNSGQIFGCLADLAELASPDGPWVIVDGYHSFMAIPIDWSALADRVFFLTGGYKYVMAGEGIGICHAPSGFAQRPALTGWFAEFDDRARPPGMIGYQRDARRLLGATYDPSALYRFNAVRAMLDAEGLSTAAISDHVAALQDHAIGVLADTPIGAMTLLNPLDGTSHARFLAFASPDAPELYAKMTAAGIVTDLRGDVLRIGFGIYHDIEDADRLALALRGLD